jgi:hypothetical protein
MEETIAPPNQRARYVAIEEPASIEGYVDELVQNMGQEGLRLFQVVPMRRAGDTVGFWLFFSEVAIPVQQAAVQRPGR